MASASLQSRGEVDAAKRLLDVARKWHDSATEMRKRILDEKSVNGGSVPSSVVEFADLQVKDSGKEADAARTHLKEVETKWEVIDIDVDDGEPTSPAGAKNAMICSDDDGSGARDTRSSSGEDASRGDNARVNDASAADTSDSGSEVTLGRETTNVDSAPTSATATSNSGTTVTPGRESANGGLAPTSATVTTNSIAVVTPGKETANAAPAPTEGAPIVKRECLDLTRDEDTPPVANVTSKRYIHVDGCGISDINGVYMRVETHGNAPRYIKVGLQTDNTYTIEYGGSHRNDKKWVIRSGADEYYYARAYGTQRDQPPGHWRTQRSPGKGKLPAPSVSVIPVPSFGIGLSRAGKKVIAIEVVHSWMELPMDGIYTPDVSSKRGTLSYSKSGVYRGRSIELVLWLQEERTQMWRMSILCDGTWTESHYSEAADSLPTSWHYCQNEHYTQMRTELITGTTDEEEQVGRANKRSRY